MFLITTREYLLRTVSVAERVAGKKESLPVLSCLLLTADTECVVRSTNLESGVEARLQGEIREKGSCAVPATLFASILRSLSSDPVTIKTESENVVIETKGSRTLIKSIPHEEFPSITLSSENGITLPRAELVRGIQSVMYAASPSMIRPELGSVLVRFFEDELTCAATDSFRLAEKKIRGLKGGDMEILVPLKHAQELLHILEKLSDTMISLSMADSQLVMRAEGVVFFSRVTEGTFPQYGEIIPKQYSTEATVLKSDFSDGLKKARLFSGSDHQVGLHLYPERKIFSTTAQSPNVGEMSDTLEAALSGQDLDINFHIGYLGDCLSSIPADSMTLGFAGVGRPLVMRAVSDTSFTYLVMPLNR